ncbi:hypothetical protein JK359_08185 [Streptomyces actinomycinicus]|uniref:Uncharacterized protein n=2 Tax=Streptomyces actinomycinicus TaxID=1695166 RepID=A0A937EGH8_9ACTN|nr:hypothetical protein [Streptomyces actinomycinicus]
MHIRMRTLRFTAVLTLVVLALTGFSAGRHGRHHGSGGGGGGCSSSHQDHDSSSSSSSGGSYDDPADDGYGDPADDTYGSGGTNTSGGTGGGTYHRRPTQRSTSSPGSGTALKDGKARLVSCATEKARYATVEVSNPNGREADFKAHVEFDDGQDSAIGDNAATVTVPAHGTARVQVELVGSFGVRDDGLVLRLDHCTVDPVARLGT